MIMGHICFLAVYNITYKFFTVGHMDIGAVVVFCFFLIDKKQMISSLAAGYIAVLPQFDLTFCASSKCHLFYLSFIYPTSR